MASRNRWVAGLFSLFAAAASPSFAQAPARCRWRRNQLLETLAPMKRGVVKLQNP